MHSLIVYIRSNCHAKVLYVEYNGHSTVRIIKNEYLKAVLWNINFLRSETSKHSDHNKGVEILNSGARDTLVVKSVSPLGDRLLFGWLVIELN